MDFHRRKAELLPDVRILDRQSLGQRLALHPFGRKTGTRDGAAAAERLELCVFDNAALLIHLDLQLHDITALRRSDQACTHIGVFLRKGSDVARVVVVIDYLVRICHYPLLVLMLQWPSAPT